MIVDSTYYLKLAQKIVNHSCSLQENEKVLIEAIDVPADFLEILIQEVYKRKVFPFINLKSDKLARAIGLGANKTYYQIQADTELYNLKKMNAFIGIKNISNAYELSDIPPHTLKYFRNEYLKPVHFEYRNNNLKWVYLRWPSEAMAQRASMSTRKFINYYFEACLFDFSFLSEELSILKDLMSRTKEVRIVGPGNTDLSFRINGMSVYVSTGEINLPDGEIFTAPIKESVNGVVTFNVPSIYHGKEFRNVQLEIRNGRIIIASCEGNTSELIKILDTDFGARYFGEFALGLNTVISNPINEILFDEKMHTSLHLAIGNAYQMADNGNRSAIHWDLILDQSIKNGGGEIYFDNILIRKNGLFILPELKILNSEKC